MTSLPSDGQSKSHADGQPTSRPPPTVVIVHGAWHIPEHYLRLTSALQSRGYDVHVPLLPSCDDKKGPRHDVSVRDDSSFLRETVLQPLATAGRTMVVVAHSYGGLVASDAMAGLSEDDLAAEQGANDDGAHKGGIRHAVYVAAFMIPKDQRLDALTDGKPPPIYDYYPDGRILVPTRSAHLFCADAPAAAIVEATKLLVPHSLLSHQSSSKFAAWRVIPSTYVLATKDLVVPPEYQEKMLADARAAGARVDEVRCECGHSPWLIDGEGEKVVEAVVKAFGQL